MRIALIAPLAEAVPPKLYGGTERVVYWLTEELVEMGHEVTLFESGDSVTNARFELARQKHCAWIAIAQTRGSFMLRSWHG